jgi:hypothetical protein
MFRTVPLYIIRSFSLDTQQWFMSYRFAAVWHIPLLCVQWKTPDDVQRNCPKHVEFYSKNKFEKLVHLVAGSVMILLASCQQNYMTYNIAVCTVKNSWWCAEELSETCLEFYSKNKFQKLVHLVGFIIRIYHDARSPERQIIYCTFPK